MRYTTAFAGDVGEQDTPPPRADMRPRAAMQATVRNALLRQLDPVPACRIEIAGHSVIGQTGNSGIASLRLSGIPDGTYRIRFTPRDAVTSVGPATAMSTPRAERLWIPLEAVVTVARARITAAAHPALQLSGRQLVARLQPAWMASPNHSPRPAGQDPSMLVVHHTAGPRVGPTLNTFLGPEKRSAHYVIDVDGKVIKMVRESEQAWHAGTSHWAGRNFVNQRSVGIEIVNATGPYPRAQLTSLTRLLRDLIRAYPSIPASAIIGHSDIATNDGPYTAARPRRLGRKSGDPGPRFDWSVLRLEGLGIPILVGPARSSALSDFFGAFPTAQLALGDRDAGKVYGHARRPAVRGRVIAHLQARLRRIGYWCPATGRYDVPTRWAVQMFQEHFTSAAQTLRPGQVDTYTASLLDRAG
jgi:N-acetyl-anhydromuramyl-L-alanine amidase AmpD